MRIPSISMALCLNFRSVINPELSLLTELSLLSWSPSSSHAGESPCLSLSLISPSLSSSLTRSLSSLSLISTSFSSFILILSSSSPDCTTGICKGTFSGGICSSTCKALHIALPADQMRAHGEQMRAQLKAQGEEMRTYAEMVRDLVQAIQMSGLQISLPAPHLVSPSTSEPPRPADTQ
ncbi:uncharacterized protein LOC126618142 [Malus sylvestris]|uniref:uncharacterized protein LOC126618142 n=1 Tax=Malus sylvestris TaxID=3752 RepID=UPI0021AC3835|nr:uncharacterized protein LOC126618142 [Malus sylvestris]